MPSASIRPLLEHFWDTSSRRALAMAHIARQLYTINPDLAYTCGLFSHGASLILMQGVRGYAGTFDRGAGPPGPQLHRNRKRRAPHRPCRRGALVARTWRMPTPIYQAVRLHHDFSALDDSRLDKEVRTWWPCRWCPSVWVNQFEGVKEHQEWSLHGKACLAHLAVVSDELEGLDRRPARRLRECQRTLTRRRTMAKESAAPPEEPVRNSKIRPSKKWRLASWCTARWLPLADG